MKYNQLDRIIEIQPGASLTAERTLRPEEDFLRDHFPNFPVMPGVMMLEALHQAAVWMIRTGNDFQQPLVVLREARGVKFGDFLCPGDTLVVHVQRVSEDGPLTTVRASGRKGEQTTVQARLVLETCPSATPPRAGVDAQMRQETRQQFRRLFGAAALPLPPGQSECPSDD